MAVSSKYTQDLSVQILFFTFSCKWFRCFFFWAVIWSYIVDLFTALHELASGSARTLLKLASSVRALLKPYGDTLSFVDTNQHEYRSEICTIYFYILPILKLHLYSVKRKFSELSFPLYSCVHHVIHSTHSRVLLLPVGWRRASETYAHYWLRSTPLSS